MSVSLRQFIRSKTNYKAPMSLVERLISALRAG